MPTKDNIKPFDAGKRPSGTKNAKKAPVKGAAAKKAPARPNAKPGAKSAAKKPAASGAKVQKMPNYRAVKQEITEQHKIENIQNREERRIARNEDRRIRQKQNEEKRVVRKQKRTDRKTARKEGFAYTFSDKVLNEATGIIILGFGIFMFMCLVSDSVGVLGIAVDEFMHGLFGYFSYVLPIGVVIMGICLIVNATRSASVKIGKAVAIAISVYLLFAWLQTFPYAAGKFDDDTFMIFLKSTYNRGLESVGTGLLASLLTYAVVYLFGMSGAKFLLLLGLLAAVLFATNRSLGKTTQLLVERLKAKEKQRKEKVHTLARSEMRNVNNPIQSRPQRAPISNGGIRKDVGRTDYSEPPISALRNKHEDNTQDDEYIEDVYAERVSDTPSAAYRDKKQSQARPQQPRKTNIINLKPSQSKHSEPEYQETEEYGNASPEMYTGTARPTITEMPEITGEERQMNVTVDGEILDDGMTQSVAAPVDGIEETQYIFPAMELLEAPAYNGIDPVDEDEVYRKAESIEQTLSDFGIAAKVINITHGPVITRYECSVPSGTKMSKVTSLDKELAYSLECASIRIEAPIPGKAAIGIEVPNEVRSTVYLRELLESPEFVNKESLLAFAVGKDIAGNIIIGDIAKMPHTLICGATGSGKSVFVNGILLSLLYKASPNDVKLIMVDPKKVEFEKYKGIPHLLFPVVSNPKRAAGVLAWCVKEMEDRYEKMAKVGVRDLRGYNKLMKSSPSDDPDLQPLPLIVIVIDELSDLMVVARDEVEDHIYRLAQMARAAGMYLLIATQRPSVDVVTGVIKANIPSRIALKTASPQDSRTILNSIGAEQLLGNGDMIYKPQGLDRSLRVQGAWVSDDDVEKVVEFVRSQNVASSQVQTESLEEKITEIDKRFVEAANTDELLEEAIAFVVKEQEASVSMLQRRFRIGHGRAGNLIDEMEKRGVVGPHTGSKPREVLLSRDEYEIGFTPEDKNMDY